MWLRFLRFFYGYVQFTSEGGFPERFLSEAADNGLQITDTRRQGERFLASCPAAQYRLLRPIAKRACMRLKITRKRGMYFRLFGIVHTKNRQDFSCLFLILIKTAPGKR